MAAGVLERAELNTTTPGTRTNLYRVELDAVAQAAAVLYRVELDAVTVADGLLLRVEVKAGNVAASKTLRAEMSSIAAPVTAGADVSGLEPYIPTVLQGAGGNSTPGTQGWSQISGPAVSLTGTGDHATYTPPGSAAGVVLVFQYQVDGATATVKHTVLPTTERGATSGALFPIRPH